MNKLLLLSTTVIFSFCAQAQTSLNTLGETYTSPNGSVSFSVGVTAYTSLNSDSFEVNQGIQHPVEYLSTSINQLKKSIDHLSVFPNPCTQSFTVNGEFNEINFVISDMQGRCVLKGQAVQGKSISTEHLLQGLYLLSISENNYTGTSIIKLVKN